MTTPVEVKASKSVCEETFSYTPINSNTSNLDNILNKYQVGDIER